MRCSKMLTLRSFGNYCICHYRVLQQSLAIQQPRRQSHHFIPYHYEELMPLRKKRLYLGKQPLIQVVSGGVWWFFSLILAVLGSKNSCISFRKELTRDAKTQMRLQSSWPYGLNLQDSRNFVDLCLAHFTVREDWDLFKICSKFLTTGCTDLEIKFWLPTALPCHSKFRWAS